MPRVFDGLHCQIKVERLHQHVLDPASLRFLERFGFAKGRHENDPARGRSTLDHFQQRHAVRIRQFQIEQYQINRGFAIPKIGQCRCAVFGLIHVLGNLDKPETLGPMIAAAFIATLLGVASANVVFLPMAARLKQLSVEELHSRELVVEGILAIQAGDNPRVVQEKLLTFVPPAQRPADGEPVGGGASAEKAAA